MARSTHPAVPRRWYVAAVPGQVAMMASPARARALDVPVAGSLAVRHVVGGPRQAAVVLGVTSGAVHVRAADGTLLALLSPMAARLPLGLVTGAEGGFQRLADAAAAGPARVGAGSVDVGAASARVVRWWDPRLPAGLAAVVVPVEPAVSAAPTDAVGALRAALRTSDPDALRSAAAGLAGLGPGLTPAGDDVLIGLQSALTCFRHPLAGVLPGAVRGRTTDLAQALLHHAADGCPLGEVAAVLRAAAGHGDPARAMGRLLAVGRSSGPALALGLAVGVGAVVGP